MTEKLVIYQQNLKERAKQLKDMVGELKKYQALCHATKFEIERLDGQIQRMKEIWFDRKRQLKMGIIPEQNEDEGGYGMDQDQA